MRQTEEGVYRERQTERNRLKRKKLQKNQRVDVDTKYETDRGGCLQRERDRDTEKKRERERVHIIKL